MRSLRNLVAVLVVAASAAGCSASEGPRTGPEPARAEAADVRVTNSNWSDMTVYVERAGHRSRLGSVTSMQSATFQIPRAMMSGTGSLRLVADPLGSAQPYVTPVLQVWPGQTVDFTIQNHLAISSVSVLR